MFNKVDLLFQAFQPPEVNLPVEPLEDGICAISGKAISEGVPIRALVTAATNQPHEIFKVPHSRHVSVEAARLFKQMRAGGMTGNLLATPDGGFRPMISRDSALKANRPCWHDVVNELPAGTPTVAIFSTDTKRRLWVQAEVGIVGPAWTVYLHDDYISQLITVDIYATRECLALCEELYSMGFNKEALRSGLYEYHMLQQEGVSLARLSAWEQELRRWRGTQEFQLSVFIVQKRMQGQSDADIEKEDKEACLRQMALFN